MPNDRLSRLSSSQANDGPILEVRGVERSFRSRSGQTIAALGRVSLNLGAGAFVAIVGPSGCGKTTLLKMIGGLIPPTSGEILYKGRRVHGAVRDLGIVFQRPVLLEWLTILNNITLQLKMRRIGTAVDQRARASDLLRRVGLEGYEDRYPWELSGGQQQRVSLCRSLIHDPSLLVMDEPFGALDALTREQLQEDLERLWMEQRPTVLFVTHDVAEAVTLADRVIVMSGRPGVIAEDIDIPVPRPRGTGLLENPALQSYARRVRAKLAPGAGSH
jgi:NitT/TauT family transport system ATP-binding protein